MNCEQLIVIGYLFLNDQPFCLLQVRERILERCKEVEKTAIEQATDNAILDQLGKVMLLLLKQSFSSKVLAQILEVCPNFSLVCLVG